MKKKDRAKRKRTITLSYSGERKALSGGGFNEELCSERGKVKEKIEKTLGKKKIAKPLSLTERRIPQGSPFLVEWGFRSGEEESRKKEEKEVAGGGSLSNWGRKRKRGEKTEECLLPFYQSVQKERRGSVGEENAFAGQPKKGKGDGRATVDALDWERGGRDDEEKKKQACCQRRER